MNLTCGALIYLYYVFCYFVYISLLEKCGMVIICRSVRIAYVTTVNREAPYVFSCDRSREIVFRFQTTAGKLPMHGYLPWDLDGDSTVQENPSHPICSQG